MKLEVFDDTVRCSSCTNKSVSIGLDQRQHVQVSAFLLGVHRLTSVHYFFELEKAIVGAKSLCSMGCCIKKQQ